MNWEIRKMKRMKKEKRQKEEKNQKKRCHVKYAYAYA